MRSIVLSLVFVATLLAQGCIGPAVKDQIKESAEASDVYDQLIRQTLDGTIAPEDGVPVTAQDLAQTPAPVRALLNNVTRALYVSRAGWHKANFAANDGPDPSGLDLEPPAELGGVAPVSSEAR